MANNTSQLTFAAVPFYPIWGGIICVAFYYIWFVAYSPDAIPWYFGPLVTIGKDIGTQYPSQSQMFFIVVCFLDILEGIIAVSICRINNTSTIVTFQWWIQTTVLGILSMSLLVTKLFKMKCSKSQRKHK